MIEIKRIVISYESPIQALAQEYRTAEKEIKILLKDKPKYMPTKLWYWIISKILVKGVGEIKYGQP